MSVLMLVGAHVGDMELTCGGLVASEALRGNRSVIVAMTAGEKGNPPGMPVQAYREQKVREAAAFAGAFGGTSVVLDSEDGMLEEDDRSLWPLVDLIRIHRPDAIVTHWKNSVHKDHRATSRIVEHARYYAGNAGFERHYPAHACPDLFYAENLEDLDGFSPFLYVDITAGYEDWIRELKKIEFVTKSTDHRYLDYYEALATIRGCDSGYHKAEAFMVRDVRHMRLEDSIFGYDVR